MNRRSFFGGLVRLLSLGWGFRKKKPCTLPTLYDVVMPGSLPLLDPGGLLFREITDMQAIIRVTHPLGEDPMITLDEVKAMPSERRRELVYLCRVELRRRKQNSINNHIRGIRRELARVV